MQDSAIHGGRCPATQLCNKHQVALWKRKKLTKVLLWLQLSWNLLLRREQCLRGPGGLMTTAPTTDNEAIDG